MVCWIVKNGFLMNKRGLKLFIVILYDGGVPAAFDLDDIILYSMNEINELFYFYILL